MCEARPGRLFSVRGSTAEEPNQTCGIRKSHTALAFKFSYRLTNALSKSSRLFQFEKSWMK